VLNSAHATLSGVGHGREVDVARDQIVARAGDADEGFLVYALHAAGAVEAAGVGAAQGGLVHRFRCLLEKLLPDVFALLPLYTSVPGWKGPAHFARDEDRPPPCIAL